MENTVYLIFDLIMYILISLTLIEFKRNYIIDCSELLPTGVLIINNICYV